MSLNRQALLMQRASCMKNFLSAIDRLQMSFPDDSVKTLIEDHIKDVLPEQILTQEALDQIFIFQWSSWVSLSGPDTGSWLFEKALELRYPFPVSRAAWPAIGFLSSRFWDEMFFFSRLIFGSARDAVWSDGLQMLGRWQIFSRRYRCHKHR